jgi:ABC-type sugar transport system ATPase subunit
MRDRRTATEGRDHENELGRLTAGFGMSNDDVVLRTQGITKRFPGTLALDNVAFTLRRGELHGLVGENGAGKSTFVKILSGVYPKDAGDIWLNGKHFNPKSILHCSQNGISIIYQESAIVPDLTVAENIVLNELTSYGRLRLSWRRINADARKWMDELGVHIDPRTRAGTLPVGQQKIVELVKAVSTNPVILILDEVTANLDAEEEELLFRTVLKFIAEKRVSVIYISHRMREVFSQCHQVTVFKDGKVVGQKEVCGTNIDEISSMMVGRDLKEKGYYRKAEPASAVSVLHASKGPVLEIRDLTRAGSYKNISFDLRRGEILGIGGLADAGQQDIAATLYGDVRPDSGKILLNGVETRIGSPSEALAKGIGFLPRNRDQEGLVLIHSISNNICLPILNQISPFAGTINLSLKKKVSDTYFRRLNIKAPNWHTPCISLSGGNRQKVVFAKLVASKVNVMILNHPTAGVDVGAKQEFYALMEEFTKRGLSIILVSDELPELMGMSDRIVVMRSGQVAHVTEAGDLPKEEQLVRYMLK